MQAVRQNFGGGGNAHARYSKPRPTQPGAGQDTVHVLRCLVEVGVRMGRCREALGYAARAGKVADRFDLDPQANSTVVLDPARVLFTSNDVLADGRAGVMAQAIVKSGWGDNVDLVASERALEHRAVPEGDGSLRLRVTMQGLDEYDLILIDTPPALGELTRNALTAS